MTGPDLQLGRTIQFAYDQGDNPWPILTDRNALADLGFRQIDTGFAGGDTETPKAFAVGLERIADKFRVLSIRGTMDGAEWAGDAEFWQAKAPWGSGRTEEGFTAFAKNFTLASGRQLEDLGFDAVEGHSLGAAIAELLGARLGVSYLGLWACPRVGDDAWASWVESRVKTIFRPVMDGDAVTAVPLDVPPMFQYRHPGQAFPLILPATASGSPASRHALANYFSAASALLQAA